MRTKRDSGGLRRVTVGHLSFKKEYVDKILKGLKTTTIRLGIITPKRPELIIYSDGKAVAKVFVESIRYLRVKDLTDKDARLDGFRNKRELIESLSKHYPGLSPNDWVTIIKFRILKKFKERKVKGINEGEIAKLGLAYNLAKNKEEYRILAAIATTGSIDGAYEMLNRRYSKSDMKKLLLRILKEIKESRIDVLKSLESK